ncbi:MAG: TraR/DksA family transcriptional regulator [Actinomycetota bacterium]
MDEGELVERMRWALSDQRAQLRREIAEQGADPDSDEVSFVDDAGFSDRSHSTQERSRLISVVEALRSDLADVERALERIDVGTYGTCERCGKPIDPARLEARPWALLCIDCKQKR